MLYWFWVMAPSRVIAGDAERVWKGSLLLFAPGYRGGLLGYRSWWCLLSRPGPVPVALSSFSS